MGAGSSEDLPGFTQPCLSYQSGMPLRQHSPRGQETTSHLIPEPGALAHGGWLAFPMPSNCTASTGAQCSDSSKFTPVRQNHLFLLFPVFLLCSPLAPFHAPFCRKTFPKFKTLRGNRGEGEQWAASCNTSPLPGHNRATPIPAEACSQPLHFSQSTNKACPTRNWAACSDLPQKCSFS